MTLAEFLAARYDEKEREAPDVHHRDCDSIAPLPFPCDCGVPARVLREVEAGREILRLHAGVVSDYGGHDFGKGALACRMCGVDDGWYGVAWPCPTLLAKAAVYSDHKDYDEAWKP